MIREFVEEHDGQLPPCATFELRDAMLRRHPYLNPSDLGVLVR